MIKEEEKIVIVKIVTNKVLEKYETFMEDDFYYGRGFIQLTQEEYNEMKKEFLENLSAEYPDLDEPMSMITNIIIRPKDPFYSIGLHVNNTDPETKRIYGELYYKNNPHKCKVCLNPTRLTQPTIPKKAKGLKVPGEEM